LDTYGSVEFSRLAFECPEHTGLHVITDGAVVELLMDGKPVSVGEPGRVVVTGLYNYAMPLIRYDLDDLAVQSSEACPCGRSWPLIRSIEGRSMDYLTMPSGRQVFPGFIYYVINSETKRHARSIAQFQVVQKERAKVAVMVVKGAQFDTDAVARIKDKMERSLSELGETVVVEVQIVPEIVADRSGKTKLVVSTAT
jgi:phenylacetate-CoA ligase